LGLEEGFAVLCLKTTIASKPPIHPQKRQSTPGGTLKPGVDLPDLPKNSSRPNRAKANALEQTNQGTLSLLRGGVNVQ
jgi:hypothetical protein